MSVLCVTQKSAVTGDFLTRIEKILSAKPYALILREKQMQEDEYSLLAHEVNALCMQYEANLFLNADISYTMKLAKKMSCGVHTSFENYKNILEHIKKMNTFDSYDIKLGLSIHSRSEAHFIAQNHSYIPITHVIAGHIFATDCKKGLAPRGLDFLKNIVDSIPRDIPVFGIGGMTPMHTPLVLATGAKGLAVMSSLMKCENPIKLMDDFMSQVFLKD